MNERLDPAQALAITRHARARMARHAGTPRWYAPLYGLGCGAMVASLAFRGPAQAVVGTAALMGIIALYSYWSRSSGLKVNGYRRGRTLPITIAVLVTAMLAIGIAAGTRDIPGYGWTPLVCGAVFGVISALASAAWDRRWIADIEDGR